MLPNITAQESCSVKSGGNILYEDLQHEGNCFFKEELHEIEGLLNEMSHTQEIMKNKKVAFSFFFYFKQPF